MSFGVLRIRMEIFDQISTGINSPNSRQIRGMKMQDANSTEVNRGGRRLREETPLIETVGGKLRVWRDQKTNEIVIEPPVSAPGMLCGGLISLSERHARHLANSLLLFVAEQESSLTFIAATSPIKAAQDE